MSDTHNTAKTTKVLKVLAGRDYDATDAYEATIYEA